VSGQPAALRALPGIPTGMSGLAEHHPAAVGLGSCPKAQKCRKQARRCLVPGRALASLGVWTPAAISGWDLLHPFKGQSITHFSSFCMPPLAPREQGTALHHSVYVLVKMTGRGQGN